MTSESRIPLIYSRVIVAAASRTPSDSKRLLQGTSINARKVGSLEAGVTLQDYRRLLRNAVEVTGEPTILLDAGARMPLAAHGPIGSAATCSPDRMSILDLLTRFIKLRGFFVDVWLERAGHFTRFNLQISDELDAEKDPALDFILGTVMRAVLFRGLIAMAEPRVQLMRPRGADHEHYKRVLGASIRYEQPGDCIIFDTEDLNRPLPAYDPEQFDIAVKKCQTLMTDEMDQGAWRDAVERIFEQTPGMLWTIDHVAQRLYTSSRTLQRHLKKEGTGYQEVLDNWLKKLAARYMDGEKLSVEATATLLGYHDEANFRRAFKRWHGCSPLRWRETSAAGESE